MDAKLAELQRRVASALAEIAEARRNAVTASHGAAQADWYARNTITHLDKAMSTLRDVQRGLKAAG